MNDKYIMFDGKLEYHSNRVPRFNPCGLWAWFTGAGLGLLMTLSGFGAGYAPLVVFITSVVVYKLMLNIAKPEWFVTNN